MDRLDYSSSKHFLYFFSEGLLKMDRYGSAGCLFRCNGWICMNMIWFTWKSAYAFKEFWILFLDLFFCLMILIFFGVSSQGIMGLEVAIMDSEFGWTSSTPCCCCVDVDCACTSF